MDINRLFDNRLSLIPALAGTGNDTQGNDPVNIPEPPVLFASGSGDSGKNKVRVRRRRRTDDSGERERADAPRRRQRESRPATSKPAGSGGGARPPAMSSLPIPGGRSPLLLIGIIVLLVVCALPLMLFFGGGDSGDSGAGQPLSQAPTRRPTEIPPAVEAESVTLPTAIPFVAPDNSSVEGQTWTVMLYQDADDKILEQDIYLDLNEAERAGSNERVNIVAQVDRYGAGYQGDGNWSGTKRFYLTQDGDLARVNSQQIADIGEANMSDGQTLVDFVTWAVDTFPADKYVLIMSDHGMGWPGGWSDPEPGGRDPSNVPLASALGDELFLMELDDALGQIRAQTGIEEFEVIGLDACLMGHVEVFSTLAPHARYAVASQETEPAVGWAYAGFLDALRANPDMSGAGLSQSIIDSYIRGDQRIVDDQARAEFLQKGSPLGGLFGLLGSTSAAQLADQMEQNITLTAVDLAAMPSVLDTLNNLSDVLQDVRQEDISKARSYAQSFTSVFGKEVPPSYIDLGNFAQLLKRETGDSVVSGAADQLLAALDQAIIAERHGPKKPGATGMSVYFPNSRLYQSPVTGPESYTAVAERFSDASLWDDFLAFHYTGRNFSADAGELAVPERDAQVEAPGAARFTVSPVSLSADEVAPGETILLSTDISGENVGYVYLFVGFLDREANSIFMADSDYLEAAMTRKIDGIYYPDWGDEADFTMEFEWEPVVFAIDDGQNSVVALFTPETYGATFEDAVYTVDGIYTYADGESRHARLYFNDGYLRQVFGFTEDGGRGAPREITPQPGDTFTVLEQWLDLDAQGNVSQVSRQEGGTLTFGDQMFTWETLDAAAGDYVVGFIVEDLDGNRQQTFADVTVR